MAIETNYLHIQDDLIRRDLVRVVKRSGEHLLVFCEDDMHRYQFSSEMEAIECFCYIQRVLG